MTLYKPPLSRDNRSKVDIKMAERLRTELDSLISSETRIFGQGDAEYQPHAYQYAKSSHDGMAPNMIIYPTSLEEILNIVGFAKKNRLGVAVRTGGHQYSGKIDKFVLPIFSWLLP